MDDHGEVQRSRDRLHKIEGALVGIGYRLRSMEHRLDLIEPKVDRMARADEIAEAVQARIGRQRRVKLTRWQTIGAWVVALAAVADTVSHFLPH